MILTSPWIDDLITRSFLLSIWWKQLAGLATAGSVVTALVIAGVRHAEVISTKILASHFHGKHRRNVEDHAMSTTELTAQLVPAPTKTQLPLDQVAQSISTAGMSPKDEDELSAVLHLRTVAEEFCSIEARMGDEDYVVNHHVVVSQVHALLAAILHLENLGLQKEVIRDVVAGVRALHGRSPIIARLQNWPRGYAGDYQTVEILLAGHCLSPEGTLAHHLERYVLDCAATQQHRNKVLVQAELIRSTMTGNPEAAILIVACGSSPDLRMLLDELKSFRGELWLNDIDHDALAHSLRMILPVFPNVKKIPGNVIELMRNTKTLPRFDLVVAGGLFDYLEDRVARFVTKSTYGCLKPGGRFFFTNIGRNPYRPWMEYFGEWFLRERDADELLRLACDSGIAAEKMSLSTDATGLTYLVELAK